MTQDTLSAWDDLPSDSDSVPPRCLSVTVRGPWGHFRRIEGNIVKQTYRIIPRTTVAGLLAAVLGIGRDDYYDLFAPEESAIAIEPIEPLRTVNMPMNTLSTANEAMQSLNSRGKVSVKLPDPTKLRQQHNYEVLVDPAYRLYVWFANDDRFGELAAMLEDGRSHYVPSLGLSEHLAELDYHGISEVETGPTEGLVSVDSAVPNAVERVIPEKEARCQVEESPAFMTADAGGRTTTGFTSYAYNPDAGPLTVRNPETAIVDGKTVMFV
ncbi:type I-B CRISPR-associated protein Cas5b [Haladaptatus cibarius]|uniref:type I-B CRISPR-associated protein Cas5b n=1 Tax=Haladaptatus cibarius TaxID=453847 RepID=UPI000679B98F|nr:type I-B CRISPR-associated protein Cas5b [Haladaptatus cibarius]